MSFKIAVATNNGENINQHLGNAEKFYIYQVELDGSYKQIAIKNISPTNDCFNSLSCRSICNNMGCNPHDYLPSIIALIDDCKYVLASKVGKGMENSLQRYNITSFSITLSIDDAIKKIVVYENRLNKFKNNGGL